VKIVLESIELGWLPRVKFARTPGEKEALHTLFAFLEDKRLLTRGYGPRAGINDLDALRSRTDDIRASLYTAVEAVGEASSAEWLAKLREACGKLIDSANDAMSDTGTPTPDASDFASAVDQLRDAFCLVAEHVAAVYRLPAARRLADQIRSDLGSPRGAGR
jgi:hypothetical protein